jgi:hypothetical protein
MYVDLFLGGMASFFWMQLQVLDEALQVTLRRGLLTVYPFVVMQFYIHGVMDGKLLWSKRSPFCSEASLVRIITMPKSYDNNRRVEAGFIPLKRGNSSESSSDNDVSSSTYHHSYYI